VRLSARLGSLRVDRMSTPIAITTGEPAGIGPQIALVAAASSVRATVLLGDAGLLRATASNCGIAWPLPGQVSIAHIAADASVTAGRLDARNARYVLRTLDRAIEGCVSGEFAAMATAPVHKGVINDAGVPFTGHTEYLAEKTHAPHVVMLLVGGTGQTTLRVALATTHLPLAQVPQAITEASLSSTFDVLHEGLRRRFGIERPRLGVAGLNPHAGEGGHLGREEIDVIAPAVSAARARGIDATGPLPADTLFVPAQLARFDAVLAMYHDQGLPVLKHATFGHGVNVTLGLPFVRTSADHGTALDLAGKGTADAGSMVAALDLAGQLSARPSADA
jgi:4-hydroxythreonine-4-phosphate dehydrogenase